MDFDASTLAQGPPRRTIDYVPGGFVYYSSNSQAAGANSDESWIFDSPTHNVEIGKKAKDLHSRGADEARFATMFDTYLEVNGKLFARVSWSSAQTWKPGRLWDSISDPIIEVSYVGQDLGKHAEGDYEFFKQLQVDELRRHVWESRGMMTPGVDMPHFIPIRKDVKEK